MSVRISWPGYAFKSKQVIIRDSSKNNNPILISKLARIIGFEVKCYIDVHRAIDGVDANWLLYPKGGIKFEHIILTKIIRVAKGSFQPILDVVRYY
ncbi:uncharacterized protein LAESUDRAFT_729086 [Laetiporus sulphureus 93-53]|uniref:Uncharacterized protein n=1 Tax=Laetiporus sulphureus 93-53 TaxID=1314785 RepID=A0A165CVM3_9APHY|nr:uncharacterized protein LAESUDRAFT_729086 [Laetiporus sulphureus 93-53]KZT03510.1 hypothetical protein LAESUDRAFT_729086 [Laetiporus sulphureus 93-53]